MNRRHLLGPLLALLGLLLLTDARHDRWLMQDVVSAASRGVCGRAAGAATGSWRQLPLSARRPPRHVPQTSPTPQCNDLSTLMTELPEALDILKVIKGAPRSRPMGSTSPLRGPRACGSTAAWQPS